MFTHTHLSNVATERVGTDVRASMMIGSRDEGACDARAIETIRWGFDCGGGIRRVVTREWDTPREGGGRGGRYDVVRV